MDNSIFSPQTDSNMHHRGAWMELDGGTMGSTRTGRWGASLWTWRQFWGITNLAISKGISWWCFGGIDDPEKGTIFFGKGRSTTISIWTDRSISLIHSESISSAMPLLLWTHRSEIGDLRKRFLIKVYSSQRLLFYAFNGFRAFHSSLEQCARPIDTAEYLIGTFVVYKWGPT